MTTAVPTNINPWSVSAPYENYTYDLQNVISRKWVDSPNIRDKVASAPEIVLYMAADQLAETWKLKKELRKLRETQANPPKDFDIDLTYAFFIVMGGVRIDVKDLLSWPDIGDSSRWGVGSLPREDVEGRETTVRVSGTTVLWPASQGHWVKIPRAKITDKSKADTFQKILVLIQVSWIVMRCIPRWIYNLPLTLLEVHTMAHVFYTTISANLALFDPREVLPDDSDMPLR
ncbi:uncharacterized protein NECHADRAFT_88170 [Fusarium vanettenii 77-13-4]|uniref:Uncharacterized protein n=1 Tax=Fusarium vanettenii (strain ATCC MYA-4622 / CBS 123669 / FGSC 9596 / NRRL 45880 / 77-13-4) TaxID=660122 RepID=C7ZDX9_FUSV7|nr:uncharacterized protein NECHADRAFT_88170 [Fusarium vanettenii 77-13-4]EEU37884.1 hypothetical protein NECHADRAFT_88170 [Fusarium vanettenii 77-13-4]